VLLVGFFGLLNLYPHPSQNGTAIFKKSGRFIITMLQWTRRLRDVLEANHFRLEDTPLSKMREVELSGRHASFPDRLRWQALTFFQSSCIHLCKLDDYFDCCYSECLLSQSTDACADMHQFDVFWLSPTIFVSRFSFYVNRNALFEYVVSFKKRNDSGEGPVHLNFYVYQLASFEGKTDTDAKSLLPLAFLRHLIALLPADYFAQIWLGTYNYQDRLPVSLNLQLLSIIPLDAPPCATIGKHFTTIVLAAGVTGDDLATNLLSSRPSSYRAIIPQLLPIL
jgi:hypothetical protein